MARTTSTSCLGTPALWLRLTPFMPSYGWCREQGTAVRLESLPANFGPACLVSWRDTTGRNPESSLRFQRNRLDHYRNNQTFAHATTCRHAVEARQCSRTSEEGAP